MNKVETIEELEAKLKEVKAAQKAFSTFTQEQVDKIFLAAATAANQARIPLAKRLSKTTMPLSTSITLTVTRRPAA